MHVYLIGICGTGMGSLATLLVDAGYRVSGSDPSPRPPMSEVLAKRGIQVLNGWRAENVDAQNPDLVVVGNVCRKDNPEALRAVELGYERVSMPGAIARLLLPDRLPLVVAGTHGKTTTTAVLGSILMKAGLDPTILVGGVALDLGGSSRRGNGRHFVIEGDEYDSAFFEKVPKFWSYSPWGAIIGSVEHDHLDIYPDEVSYLRAFKGFVEKIDPQGVLVLWAADPLAVQVARHARCRTIFYALSTDTPLKGVEPTYVASLRSAREGVHRLELRVRYPTGEVHCFPSPLAGEHNARNVLSAIILCHEVAQLSPEQVGCGISTFRGVALRQQLIGTGRSVRIYRDFAHHPEAVLQTVRAMRPLAQPGRLVVVYEPRSATACRRLHQKAYVEAFAEGDLVILAPVGRPEIPLEEQLDTALIAQELRQRGIVAVAARSLDHVISALMARIRPGDLVLMLSNGHFGHIDQKVLQLLKPGDSR